MQWFYNFTHELVRPLVSLRCQLSYLPRHDITVTPKNIVVIIPWEFWREQNICYVHLGWNDGRTNHYCKVICHHFLLQVSKRTTFDWGRKGQGGYNHSTNRIVMLCHSIITRSDFFPNKHSNGTINNNNASAGIYHIYCPMVWLNRAWSMCTFDKWLIGTWKIV